MRPTVINPERICIHACTFANNDKIDFEKISKNLVKPKSKESANIDGNFKGRKQLQVYNTIGGSRKVFKLTNAQVFWAKNVRLPFEIYFKP